MKCELVIEGSQIRAGIPIIRLKADQISGTRFEGCDGLYKVICELQLKYTSVW